MRAAIAIPACLAVALAGSAAVWWIASGLPSTQHSSPVEGPQVVIAEPTFDFGAMDRGAPGSKGFIVRNEGTAPLEIRMVSTTCQCTLADLGENETAAVPPGHEMVITVQWDTSHSHERFRHSATFHTNDPQTPQFELVVEGHVREHLAIHPSLVFFSQLGLSETRSQDVVLYSQTFETLKITRVEATLPQLSVEVLPTDEALKKRLEASQAYLLRLTIEPGLPRGTIASEVHVEYENTGGNSEAHQSPYIFSVLGEVTGDVSFHGARLEVDVVQFRPVRQAEGATETVYLFARGVHRELKITGVKATPDFLRVYVERDDLPGAGKARHKITIHVPPGTVPISLTDVNPGLIEFQTDPPILPPPHLHVIMSILP